MLQKTGRSGGNSDPKSWSDVSTDEFLLSIYELLRRQFPLMIVVFLFVLALGCVYFFTAQPRYTATAKLLIDSRKTQLLQQQSPLGVDTPVDSAAIDSQVEILKSENVALAVIKDLRLTDEPEFTQRSGGLVGTIIGPILDLFPSEPASDYARTRTALARFDDRLSVKRLGLSYVIEISYQSIEPGRAARIANSVAEAYIIDALEAKYQMSRRAATWLQDRLKELRLQASTADRAVVEFKAQNNIVDAGGRLLNEQQLAEINSSLTIARAQRAEAQARFERISSILNSEGKDTKALFNDIATVADSLRNDVITRLRQQYLDLAARESDWASRYGSEHLAVTNLRNQMREIRRSISDELRRIAETYRSDLEIAKTREDSVQRTLAESITTSNDTNQAQIVLRELESNSQSSRALADNFLQLYMVSVQQQSFPMTEARLITQAAAPLKPSHPRLVLVGLIVLVGGGLLASAAGLFRDLMDRVFRTSAQVEANLGMNCVAVIPVVPASELSSLPVERKRQGSRVSKLGALFDPRRSKSEPRSREKAGSSNALLTTNNDQFDRKIHPTADGIVAYLAKTPLSRFAESVRSIRLAIDLNSMNNPAKIIGITSALPNEGKTTISSALGYTIAHSGSRVLMIDLDLRNPSLSQRLAPLAQLGLIEVSTGKCSLEDAICTDPQTGLDFLPCVVTSRLSNSSEILASRAVKALMDKLRAKYDLVVADLPPLAPIIDVRATAELIDSYVLVVEWARTKIAAVEYSLKNAPEIDGRFLGAILNKADISVMSRYGSYGGNYYYNQYYSRYGHTG